jgi:GNAT superfamily N-acetyltransferase
VELIRVNNLNEHNIQPIMDDCLEDGCHILSKLREAYNNESNTFNKQGEVLYIAMLNNNVVGIGGLNQDPYINEIDFGRVRNLYVMREYRKTGIGKAILQEIIDEARKHFKILGLRTDNQIAAEMYCSCGFVKNDKYEHSTHYMKLE